MKIAVIGGGISGLSAAYFLCREHEVTLFEKEKLLGGHAHTEVVRSRGRSIPVDTAFVVYNPERYPLLTKLFKKLHVRSQKTEMSLSVSLDNGAFEYNNTIPNGIFADRMNLVRPSFLELLYEITRFNSVARSSLKTGLSPRTTMGTFIARHGFSQDLQQKYLFPMVGAIWSTPRTLASDFPAETLLRFLDNHHLLTVNAMRTWYTVSGGSREYVRRVADGIRQRGGIIHSGVRVSKVVRRKKEVLVYHGRSVERFDRVVFATHPKESLQLLARSSRDERAVLASFSYVMNEVYLHRDESLMPRRKRAWAAWNYAGSLHDRKNRDLVSLTYNMNLLQHIASPPKLFVTLNPHKKIDPRLVFKRMRYEHPLYTPHTMRMQQRLHTLQNKQRTFYCGAYFGYGFHEDGIASALEVAKLLGIKNPWGRK